MPRERNLAAYDSAEVVSLYAGYSFLLPSEEYLFAKYVLAGASILDLGVGGGRTTPVLAAKAKRYVGVDYVPGMVDACASKFPNCEFVCADAAALNAFDDASFDIVVFSFNGIDVLPELKKRGECLEEVHRVLSPNGVFIFSSHNARLLANTSSLKIGPLLRAFRKTWPYSRELIRSGAFLRGAGYYRDVTHTGTEYYSSTPKLIARELGIAGFELVETTHDHGSSRMPTFLIPWHYYVARRL